MRPPIGIVVVSAALVLGCGSGSDLGGPGDITGSISIEGGGFSDTGVEGFGGLDLPNSWLHKFGRQQEGDDVGECRLQQRCGVGGVVDAFGLLTGEQAGFAVVTTGDFVCDPDAMVTEQVPEACPTPVLPVLVSGVETSSLLVDTNDGQEWTGATLKFRYALLSARADPAGAQDSITVSVRPEGGGPTRVFRVTAGDLGESLPLRPAGCGTQPLPPPDGAETSYPSCSEWTDAEIDISQFIGDSVRLEFVAGEAGAAIALAFDGVRIEVSR